MYRLLGAIAALALLAACSDQPAPPPTADPATERSLTSGDIIGFTHGEIASHVWLGVPFASAPTGDLRWRASIPHSGWDGVRESLVHGEPCAQLVNNSLAAQSYGVSIGTVVGSEDCLFADIYAPVEPIGDAPLPVMVWIHGGSNLWGTTASYSGARLAADQNVIVVMVQYRMGPFGFFAHPEIFDEAQGANFAHSDHVRALEWVRDNAEAFGGDPGNVTVFGESAGGRNTGVVLQSPMSEGLFHRAIVQSGFFSSSTLEEAQDSAVSVAHQLAAVTADDLRGVPMQAVFEPYREGDALDEMPRVIADGVSIPLTGLRSSFDDADGFHHVPVITGTNKDEMKLFNAFNDELTNIYFGFYITVPDQGLYDAASDYASRNWRLGAVDGLANQMLAAGHDQVWAYRFDWDEGGSLLGMDLGKIFGAAHAFEIPFVFNHFDVYGRLGPILFNEDNGPDRERLTAEMGHYWAEFARTGNPGGIPGVTWQPWDEGGRLMRFDSRADGGIEMIIGQETETAILSDLVADDRLSDINKCRLLTESLIDWRRDMIEHDLVSEICPDPES